MGRYMARSRIFSLHQLRFALWNGQYVRRCALPSESASDSIQTIEMSSGQEIGAGLCLHSAGKWMLLRCMFHLGISCGQGQEAYYSRKVAEAEEERRDAS